MILIAVIMSTIMTTVVGQSIGILQSMRMEQAASLNGNRYATFHQLNQEQAQKLHEDDRLYDVGDIIFVGSTPLGSSSLSLYLREYHDNALSMYPSIGTIKEGRLPEAANEIALPEDSIQYLGLDVAIGDTVSLDMRVSIMDGSLPEFEYSGNFILTGILESSYIGYTTGTVSGIVGNGTAENLLPEEYLLYSTDFKTHDKQNFQSIVYDLAAELNVEERYIQWGAKCRKAYDLDENGQRIPDGKGGWKNHREDTTDWNDKGNVEIWRAAWAAYTNRALEAAGQPALVDHRSYKRRGIDKIPSVHLGPAASQMEKRGIRTDKGEVNRQIAADNKLLKEIKARITRLYNWSKAEAEKPEGQQPSMIDLWEAQQQLKRPDTRTGKIRALQESAALFSFMQANGIKTMQQLHDKISDMNSGYYDLRGKIVQAERRIATLTERGEMWAQYNKYKPIRKQLAKVKPEKRELFEQRHSRELILYDAAARYLKELKDSGEEITPKAWQREIDLLTAQKQVDTIDMKAMREELKAVERLRKAADQLARQGQDKSHDRGPER